MRRFPSGRAVELVRERIAAGARFVGAFYDAPDAVPEIRYVVAGDDGLETIVAALGGEIVPALSEHVPAADWAERELRDRFGVQFTGIREPRALLPPGPPGSYRRASGAEVSTVLYGPVRSGIVESARWIIETAGEDFLAVYPSMFFKRRGLEELFVGVELERATFVAEHVSGATAVSHATCFARAAERALGITITDGARAARTILIELERVHQHLDALAKLADDGSLSVGAAQTFAAKERVHRLLAVATGSRFGRGAVCVGGVRAEISGALDDTCARRLEEVEREALGVVDGLFGTQSLLDRLIGTGRLSPELVRAYGGVGPVARGSGVSTDVRRTEAAAFALARDAEALEDGGDAFARARVRASEIRGSFSMIRHALAVAPTREPTQALATVHDGAAMSRLESPQGELLYYVRIADGRPARVAIRSASFANWPLFVQALPGNIFTDFSFIEHSFGLIQAETDR